MQQPRPEGVNLEETNITPMIQPILHCSQLQTIHMNPAFKSNMLMLHFPQTQCTETVKSAQQPILQA